jgi:hypothetical protein
MNLLMPKVTPDGINVDVHMKLASDQWDLHPDHAAFMIWFYYKVCNHGPWDFKQYNSDYEDFGNFHYGAVGTAGRLPEQILLRAAGYAQARAGTQDPEVDWGHWAWHDPYGDDPKDQKWIRKGIRYAEINGY